MTSKRWIRGVLGIAALATASVGAIPSSIPGAPSVSAATGPGAGGEYHTIPVETRIFDSRPTSPIGDPTPGPKVHGQDVHIQVLDKAGVPADPAEVLAIAANITVTGVSNAGFAEVYPKGFRANPQSSLINFRPGADVPNMVIVGVGNDGSITFRPQTPGAANGSVHVLVDVFGWVSKTGYVDAADTGARLVALGTPVRFLDQRPVGQAVGPGQTIALKIRGSGGVPASENVTGVVINLTADNSQPAFGHQNTFVSALSTPPAGVPRTSTTNVPAGLVKANLAFVPIGPDGHIHFYNSAGNAQLIVDVFGYLEKGHNEATYAGRIIPLEYPFRAFDTRQNLFGNIPLGFGEQEDWSFWCFADSITVNGQPVNKQSALLGNVTGTLFDRLQPHLPNDTFLKLYPRSPDRPITSNINMYPNMDVPNMAMLAYGDSDALPDFGNAVDPYMVRAYNQNGSLHYILDVFAIVLSDEPAPEVPAPSDPDATHDYCGNPLT